MIIKKGNKVKILTGKDKNNEGNEYYQEKGKDNAYNWGYSFQ